MARRVKEKDSSSLISAIRQGDKLVTTAADINKTFQIYYEKLYTSTLSFQDSQRKQELFLSNIDMPKLDIDQSSKLESTINDGEIRKAISLMNTTKSPGSNGLPVEYYKEYQEAFEKGHIPPTFNEALIYLIPKKDKANQLA